VVELIKIPFNELIAKLQEKSNKSEEELNSLITQKVSQLSGLISKEGAAHIVANELGIKLIENSGKVKDIYSGMRNVEFVAKITQVFEAKEFNRSDNSVGKVGSFLCGDETGIIRVVCWGSHADVLKQLSEGSIVKIVGGFVKENDRGFKEVHMNERSRIIVNPPVTTDFDVKKTQKALRKSIKDLVETDENVEIFGTIVQVFDPRFFEVCPTCNFKVKEVDGRWVCEKHQEVAPQFNYVVNIFLDDGTENIRVVLFTNQAERLLSKTKEEFVTYRLSPEKFEDVKTALLGEQYRFVGRIKKNIFFDRLEFVAQLVFKADPQEEIERLSATVQQP